MRFQIHTYISDRYLGYSIVNIVSVYEIYANYIEYLFSLIFQHVFIYVFPWRIVFGPIKKINTIQGK